MGDRPAIAVRPDLLTAQEVAQRLSICIKTLHRLVRLGLLPAPIRFSRKLLRWRSADIARFLRKPIRCDAPPTAI